MNSPVNFAVVNRPFGTRTERAVLAGLTIEQMMDESGITASMKRRSEVWLVDHDAGKSTNIPKESWRMVRPKPGIECVIRAFPGKGGGSGKGTLGIVLSLVVAIAASAVSAGIGGLLIEAGYSAAAAGALGALAGGAVGVTGPLHIQRLEIKP